MMTNASNGLKEKVKQNRNVEFDVFGNNQATSGTKIRIVRDPEEVMRLLSQRGRPAVQSDELKASDRTKNHGSPISLDSVSNKDDPSL